MGYAGVVNQFLFPLNRKNEMIDAIEAPLPDIQHRNSCCELSPNSLQLQL